MEQIKTASVADNYVFTFERQLHLMQADEKRSKEFLEQKIGELKKYAELRALRIPGSDMTNFLDELGPDQGLYQKYEAVFGFVGGEKPILDLDELQKLIERIEALRE